MLSSQNLLEKLRKKNKIPKKMQIRAFHLFRGFFLLFGKFLILREHLLLNIFYFIEEMQVKSIQRSNTLISLNKKALGKSVIKTSKLKEEEDK